MGAIGGQWAGSWFDPGDQGRFKIGVATSQSPPAGASIDKAKAILASKGVDTYTDFLAVTSSWADLTHAQDALNDQLSGLISAGKVTTAINPETNSVVVETTNDVTSDQIASLNTAATTVAVTIKKTTASSFIRRFESCASLQGQTGTGELACDPPLRGGVMIGFRT